MNFTRFEKKKFLDYSVSIRQAFYGYLFGTAVVLVHYVAGDTV
jgi:hypothetical protein